MAKKKKSVQTGASTCNLVQFSLKWTIIGDLFFSAVFCLHFLTTVKTNRQFFLSPKKFRPHFSAFSAFFCIFFHRAQTAFPPLTDYNARVRPGPCPNYNQITHLEGIGHLTFLQELHLSHQRLPPDQGAARGWGQGPRPESLQG